MARLKGSVKFKIEGFRKLLTIFPDLNGGYLAYIGKRGRQIMKNKYFAGQELDYSKQKIQQGFPIDKTGRRTITSNVNKRRRFVTLASYPMNLFERGRTLRSGRREAPKKVITGKLKREVATNMQRYATQYENRFLKKALKGMGL